MFTSKPQLKGKVREHTCLPFSAHTTCTMKESLIKALRLIDFQICATHQGTSKTFVDPHECVRINRYMHLRTADTMLLLYPQNYVNEVK